MATAGSASLATLTSFSGSTGVIPDGGKPYAGVLVGIDGFLYGTTHQGGTNGFPIGHGTIYKVSPAGVTTTLWSFNNTDGAQPYGALASGDDGNLYGTTLVGGPSGLGTIFRISTNGSLTTLHSFDGANGARPSARLKRGMDGAFYGTTQQGGASNIGTIFRLTTNGNFSSLHSFDGVNGSRPYAEVSVGLDSHLYGTTLTGGASNLGTVFKFATNGLFTSVFSFVGMNGATPYGGLTLDSTGVFYGTTAYGGANAAGTIFRITTNGVHTTLRSFDGEKDGANPWATLLRGQDGSYYGTTILGGAAANVPRGTVFQFMTNGGFAVLISFGFDTNGASPYGGLAQDATGNIYGTTFDQGPDLKGTVFRLNPAVEKLQSALTPAGFEIGWEAWLGKIYHVEYKTNILQDQWGDLAGPISATNGVMTVWDPLQSSGRLYRLRQFVP
jgi:uncharacterized repeat protein (TIGR03803 family)